MRIACNDSSHPQDRSALHFELPLHSAISFEIEGGKLAVAKHTYHLANSRDFIVCFIFCRKECWCIFILKLYPEYCDIPYLVDDRTVHNKYFDSIPLHSYRTDFLWM